MKPTVGTPRCYVSGPHSSDYYLLQDEPGGHILAMRLAAHSREARGICDEHAELVTAGSLEIWIDDSEKHVWYVLEGRCPVHGFLRARSSGR